MIRAGIVDEICWSSGVWLFLDIGFSNKQKSCGLLIHDDEPTACQFTDACRIILEEIAQAKVPINLTIEAPLSVAFDKLGNPSGRAIEIQGRQTRYWYSGLGCAVMVSAMYLLRKIHVSSPKQHVRLFEGFVSFKDQLVKSDHLRDVLDLRKVVKNPTAFPSAIVSSESLKMKPDDELASAFRVAGMDFGIPPVLTRTG